MTAQLELVASPADIRDSVRAFNSLLPQHRALAQSLLSGTTYWVYDIDTHTFGPAKFVGFRAITPETYEIARAGESGGTRFDGHVTRTAIERVLGGPFSQSAELRARLRRWARELLGEIGEEVLSKIDETKWLFASLPATARVGFELGRIYNRRDAIHAIYGGQRQGGISTPSSAPFIFLFTGDSGRQYGYRDGWSKDNVFLYTGEGQTGDMTFRGGNKAIRDHAAIGKDLLLFEALGKGQGYRYLGQFACASWEYRDAPDVKGAVRKVIVFHLVQPEQQDTPAEETVVSPAAIAASLDELRAKAMQAAAPAPQLPPKEARRLYYQRSEAVRMYVLARAAGVCEACKQPAPFVRPDGSPYLEPHHTRRLSDGGPDDPRFVGGVCPTCHRRIHYGQDGSIVNHRLVSHLANAEQTAGITTTQ
jgi:5-methylcytosine-specific restriction protein A